MFSSSFSLDISGSQVSAYIDIAYVVSYIATIRFEFATLESAVRNQSHLSSPSLFQSIDFPGSRLGADAMLSIAFWRGCNATIRLACYIEREIAFMENRALVFRAMQFFHQLGNDFRGELRQVCRNNARIHALRYAADGEIRACFESVSHYLRASMENDR